MRYTLNPKTASPITPRDKSSASCLDIVIRDRTDNQKSLDDVLRAMNTDFAKSGKPYRDSLDVRLTAEKVAGGSLEDFFNRYVSGAEPLPYGQLFRPHWAGATGA